MNRRERIFAKHGGLCYYSGTPLEQDWQIDHLEPVRRYTLKGKKMRDFPHRETEDNMVPCQRIINHYKHSYSIEELRRLLSTLHLRIAKLERKMIRTQKESDRMRYLQKLGSYFRIYADTPFGGVFYYEKSVDAEFTEDDGQ